MWVAVLVLAGLLLIVVNSQTSYPPQVPGGGISEDVEGLLDGISRGPSEHFVALSPDGKSFATVSDDRNVRCSCVSTGELIRLFTGGGVSREAIFFGRDEILAHVLNREPASYLVVGGRQLGKTSLLKAIQRRLENDSRVDVRFLALTGGDLTAALARSLGLSRDAGLDAVLGRLTEGLRRTLFLIDEADVLVSRQHRRLGEGDEDVFGRLRSLSEEGRFHFILTGFWSLYEAAVLDYGSPLRNFGETLRLEALEEEACVRLATEPMASMGLGYEAGAVTRLVERTGRRANLIAIACNEIVKDLDPTARTIGRVQVDAALTSKAVQDALEGWQHLAGEAESRLDRAVVYATVERENFVLAEVLETLREHGADVDADRVERSLKRLELAWVIGEEGGRLVYRVPFFVDRVRGLDASLRLREEVRRLG